jgi:hypothetical protein
MTLDELSLTAGPASDDPEVAAGNRQELTRLMTLIHALAPVDRQMVLLYLEGLDAAAIGEVTGFSSGAVATKVCHGFSQRLCAWRAWTRTTVNKNFGRVRVPPGRAHCEAKESMMTPTAEQTAPHIARFLDMLDAAFNGVLPELFHDARDRHAPHLFVRHLRLRGGPLHDGIDKGSLRDNDANPVAAVG